MSVRSNLAADGIVAATGVVGLVVAWRYLRCRAVHPDLPDPAVAAFKRIKIISLIAALLLVAANIAAIALIPVEYLFFTIAGALVVDAFVAYYGLGFVLVSVFDAYAARRRTRYVICELDYRDAPRASKAALRRIYRHERRLANNSAVQSGMLGTVPANRLVYSAAEQAIAAADVSRAIGDFKPASTDEDRAALADAESALADLKQYIADVESALKSAVGTADAAVVNPPARASAHTSIQQDRARARFTETVESARQRPREDTVEFSDRISAMSYGNEEAQRISRRVLEGPDLSATAAPDDQSVDSPKSDQHHVRSNASIVGRAAGRVAAKAAGAAAEASLSGAEYTVAKLRARKARRDEENERK